ncbi:MAG: hypothetical protein GY866_07640, partial [Proteobacteria bacterium]|nr:hypothetical protein [Pseudomonadota bacterium]
IEGQNFVNYLLEKHKQGDIEFTHKIDRKITFHDSCAWRKLDEEVYDGPRQLLEIMGADLVEMEHNRNKSLCCGAPLAARNPQLADEFAEKRVVEAKESGADTIAISCTGCFALSRKTAEHNLEIFNMTELAQMAVGEEPLHRIAEISKGLRTNLITKISQNPNLLTDKYVIKNGKVERV